jgi:L-ascorbate metabolism protein UlaG (beta-lactamase superfamily)
MNIKKIGHCCLLIQEEGLTILTDPGMFSTEQDHLTGIDLILITHEHEDHLHLESVKVLLQNNPSAHIVCNKGVGKILDSAGISYSLMEDGQTAQFGLVVVEAHGKKHAEIYNDLWAVENTGFLINNRLFYPGDSFYDPGKQIEILALPVAGPWLSIAMAVDYAKLVKPKHAFPVHDGMLRADRLGSAHLVPEIVLKEHGIKFHPLLEGDESEF